MTTLTIRTDNPEAEIGIYDDTKCVSRKRWHAHRALAETLHSTIRDTLEEQKLQLGDINAVACYKGPGSFTGLRIGLTVGNALSSALGVPIVSETGDDWQQKAAQRLLAGENETIAMPEYGADVHITLPKQSAR